MLFRSLEWFVMVGKEYTGDVNFNNAIQIIRADAISQIPAAFRPALQGLIDAPLTFTAATGRGGGGRGAAAPAAGAPAARGNQ